MTGLEKIIEHIKLENKTVCDEILSKANLQADEIKNTSQNQAQKKYDEIIARANYDCHLIAQRTASADALEAKRKILQTKQAVVACCLQKALDTMKTMNDDEYFATISGLIEKYAYKQSGELVLSQSDAKNMPKGFMENINIRLARKGASLSLCSEFGMFDRGFVLKYGDIEENCVFENLFAVYNDRLKDIAGSVLFGG